jgi:hypothetical protein
LPRSDCPGLWRGARERTALRDEKVRTASLYTRKMPPKGRNTAQHDKLRTQSKRPPSIERADGDRLAPGPFSWQERCDQETTYDEHRPPLLSIPGNARMCTQHQRGGDPPETVEARNSAKLTGLGSSSTALGRRWDGTFDPRSTFILQREERALDAVGRVNPVRCLSDFQGRRQDVATPARAAL